MSRESRQGTDLPEGDHPACSSSRKAGIPAGRARVQCLTGWGRSPPLFLFLKVRRSRASIEPDFQASFCVSVVE